MLLAITSSVCARTSSSVSFIDCCLSSLLVCLQSSNAFTSYDSMSVGVVSLFFFGDSFVGFRVSEGRAEAAVGRAEVAFDTGFGSVVTAGVGVVTFFFAFEGEVLNVRGLYSKRITGRACKSLWS